MPKRVIVCAGTGGVFSSLEEAAEVFGITAGAVSRSLEENGTIRGVRAKWAERVYAARIGEEWVVGVKSSRGGMFVPMDGRGKVSMRKVCALKDLTAVWYFSKEEW